MPLPRLLLIDPTPIGGPAATAALKAVYFDAWRKNALLHVYAHGEDRLGLDARDGKQRPFVAEAGDATRLVEAFQPSIILYRPVADAPMLHRFATEAIDACNAPLALWFMDDWPERLRVEHPDAYSAMARDLARLSARAALHFAISPGMAAAFCERFGAPFEVARNGVRIEDWPAPTKRSGDGVLMRYSGSLAPDTTRDSVRAVAEAASALHKSGAPIRLEIRTQRHWLQSARLLFAGLSGVSVSDAALSPSDYRAWLAEADIILIAYNFDAATRRYLQYSFANKIPEALAAGAPVFLVGPEDIESVAFLKEQGCAEVVTDPAAIGAALRRLSSDPDRRRDLARKARALAFETFDLDRARDAFFGKLSAAAQRASLDYEAPAAEKVQFDECRFVHALLGAHQRPGVMIDVGAHYGSSLKPFAQSGWRVLAFEPDSENRRRLLDATSDCPTVAVRAEAVGAAPAQAAPFYRSDVSTGISGMTAFHESHRPAGCVAVTTLDAAIGEAGLEAVDFLKIDVEGRELDVLNGFDLQRWRPAAIVCEFENAKTAALGYAMSDLADRFAAAGYAVWISEWRTIVAYGRRHDWRRLIPYPAAPAPDAWGNLIALRDPAAPEALAAAFDAALSGGPAGVGALGAGDAIAPALETKRLRYRISRFIWTRFPGLAERIRQLKAAARGDLRR